MASRRAEILFYKAMYFSYSYISNTRRKIEADGGTSEFRLSHRMFSNLIVIDVQSSGLSMAPNISFAEKVLHKGRQFKCNFGGPNPKFRHFGEWPIVIRVVFGIARGMCLGRLIIQ